MNLLFLIPLVINFLIAFFIYRYFIANLTLFQILKERSRALTFLIKLVIFGLSLTPPLFFICNHNGLSSTLVHVSSYFMGIVFALLFITIFYLAFIIIVRVTRISTVATHTAVIKSEMVIIAITMIYILSAFIGGAQSPQIKEVSIEIDNFPINNYKIVQLSDLHIGAANNRQFVEEIVRRVNQLEPNLVVITGDIIDTPVKFITNDLEPLKNFKAPTFAVFGNHEYYNGIYAVKPALELLGITLLNNQSVEIENSFNLIGINDPTGYRFGQFEPDFKQAVSTLNPTLPSILLAHQPKSITEVNQKIDLMLTGHTHGGQFIPFNWIIGMIHPYINGYYRDLKKKIQIYVNPGTGFWGPPMRLGPRSEITLINIKQKLI